MSINDQAEIAQKSQPDTAADLAQETSTVAEVADLAARAPIKPPEHRDVEHSDTVNINVNNVEKNSKPQQATEASVDTRVVAPEEPKKPELSSTMAVSPEGELLTSPHEEAKKTLTAEDISKAPLTVSKEEFAQAERNLAEYFGNCFEARGLKNLTADLVLSLENGYERTGEEVAGSDVAANAIRFNFTGSEIESNHVLMNGQLLGMLYEHPLIGALVKDSHPQTANFRPPEERVASHEAILSASEAKADIPGELGFFLGNLSDADYALMIKLLAANAHVKPTAPEAEIDAALQRHQPVNPKIAALAHIEVKEQAPTADPTPVKPSQAEEASLKDVAANTSTADASADASKTELTADTAVQADTRVSIPAQEQGKVMAHAQEPQTAIGA